MNLYCINSNELLFLSITGYSVYRNGSRTEVQLPAAGRNKEGSMPSPSVEKETDWVSIPTQDGT